VEGTAQSVRAFTLSPHDIATLEPAVILPACRDHNDDISGRISAILPEKSSHFSTANGHTRRHLLPAVACSRCKRAAKPTEDDNMNKTKPVHEIRLAACRAAIWANETSNGGTRHNVTLSRLYKDDAGNWKDSSNFGRDELPLVLEVVRQAWLWILENRNGHGKETQAESEG
jgi:hypothetical protein